MALRFEGARTEEIIMQKCEGARSTGSRKMAMRFEGRRVYFWCALLLSARHGMGKYG